MGGNAERTYAKKNAGTWDSTGLEVLKTGDFEGTRLKRPGIYAVCFGATWCPPTRQFVPKFVARNGHVAATLAMADITEWEDPLWDVFDIKITPTMIVFRDGAPTSRFDGRRMLGLRESDLDKLAAAVDAMTAPSGSAHAGSSR